ncbi:MAG: sugar kinase [Bdellovibrionota bacterium]
MWDVVTLGETMLRLTPQYHARLEQARTLDAEVGGSESNTSVGLARLGLKTAWVSRLTRNSLGKKVAREIASHGVDVSQVIWTDNDRIGLYFLEEGRAPRGSSVIYDRAGSAMSRMTPEELPAELFSGRPGLFHLTGITLAIGPDARQTAESAAQAAKRAGWKLSFDLNFRSRLWNGEQACAACSPLCALADVIFAPLPDVRVLFGAEAATKPESAVSFLRKSFPNAAVIVTAGPNGTFAQGPGTELIHQRCFPADDVGRLGAGDAFSAGFLFSYFFHERNRRDLSSSVLWGNAGAALKLSIPGDMPLFTRAEIELVIETHGAGIRLAR